TGISWSPDGTQLAIGVGPQLASGGVLFNSTRLDETEVLTINVDGSGLNQLAARPALSPAWSALQSAGSIADFDGSGLVDGADFLAWQRGNSPNPLSSADLAAWLGRFGALAGVAAWQPAGQPVPEPQSAALLLLTAAFGHLTVRRMARQRR
ncbi:MAG: hypothetical protein AAF961_19035, partial [Planctomycetota bacterium]